jgi:hypothetical protein
LVGAALAPLLPCHAQKAAVGLSVFPAMCVADGRSTVTVTAEVRDSGGSLVKDGARVVFETDRGSFRSGATVETRGGMARAVLQAPSSPGVARVRASVFNLNASSTIEVEFVADRSALANARDHLEIVAQDGLRYSTQHRVLEAKGEGSPAVLTYRGIVIKATDIQFNAMSWEVRARGASVTIGGRSGVYRELFLRLNQRRGLGLWVERQNVPEIVTLGTSVAVRSASKALIRVDEIGPEGIRHSETTDLKDFQYADIADALSIVEAKRAVVYPNRNVQFQGANVRLAGQSVMSLPLFQVDLASSAPVITDQFFRVTNNSVNIDYPYYLDLAPGRTSFLRLRYGNRFGNSLGATGGTYLDYEHRWYSGSRIDGGLVVSGLGRDDWGAGVRHFWQPDEETSVSAQIDFPAHRDLNASFHAARQLGEYSGNLSLNYGQSLTGQRYRSDQALLTLHRDPQQIGRSPILLTYGLTAQRRALSGLSSGPQESAGFQARIDSRPLAIDGRNTLTVSLNASKLFGTNVLPGLAHGGSVYLQSSLFDGFYLQTGIEYVRDGYTEGLLGTTRLNSEAAFVTGPFSLRGSLARSLDADRISAQLGADYRIGGLWRVSYGYTWDRYDGGSFLDQSLVLGYRLGFREVGLSYSARTKRLGIELLGARFN